MALDPLKAMATSRAKESALESFVLISGSWAVLVRLPHIVQLAGSFSSGHLVGAGCDVGGECRHRGMVYGTPFVHGWQTVSEDASAMGNRGCMGFVSSLRPLVRVRFAGTCEEKYMGAVVETLNPAVDDQLIVACQINGVPDNPYLQEH